MRRLDLAPFAAFPDLLARISRRKKRRFPAVLTQDHRKLSTSQERTELREIVRGVTAAGADFSLIERLFPTITTCFRNSDHGRFGYLG